MKGKIVYLRALEDQIVQDLSRQRRASRPRPRVGLQAGRAAVLLLFPLIEAGLASQVAVGAGDQAALSRHHVAHATNQLVDNGLQDVVGHCARVCPLPLPG